MLSRTDPQISTQTYDSPDEASTGPTPFVEEPQDDSVTRISHSSGPTNGPWFNLGTRHFEKENFRYEHMARSEQT